MTETNGTQAVAQEARPDLRGRYWLTRFVFLRFLGFIYLIAFLVLVDQMLPLFGADGLLPASHFLSRLLSAYGGNQLSAFFSMPTLFWLGSSDALMQGLAYLGVILSAILLLGFANVPLMVALWLIYMSFVHVGQIFYGYGWEILLLETGFLAIFLCPLLDGRPFNPRVPPSTAVIWLLRWVVFRVMLGAGLIKLRGDPCWRNLTCMIYHYETQPLPNPLSWYLFQTPAWFHTIEVLFNHLVELAMPWTLFMTRRTRHTGGLFIIAFQVLLILSGNLSFLNWLTIAVCISAFDDQALSRLLPRRFRTALAELPNRPLSPARRAVTYALVVLVAYLSIAPVENMFGSQQAMNESFEPFELVNTYGAFGSVGRRRYEIIIEGTSDETIGPSTQWKEYEFKCKPGDVDRAPCVVAPFQYRIDWQMWFAAMESYSANPWLIHFVVKLLHDDPGALSLIANTPFPDDPPHFIRAELYRYQFTRWGEDTKAWWKRTWAQEYLPPLSADNPSLQRYLEHYGWRE